MAKNWPILAIENVYVSACVVRLHEFRYLARSILNLVVLWGVSKLFKASLKKAVPEFRSLRKVPEARWRPQYILMDKSGVKVAVVTCHSAFGH